MIFDKFYRIGIIPNEKKDPSFENTKNLIDYLIKKFKETDSRGHIYLENDFEEKLREVKFPIYLPSLTYLSERELYKTCNLFIVLGGDGTILKTAPKVPASSLTLWKSVNIFSGEEVKLYFRSDRAHADALVEISFGSGSMKSERITIKANEMGFIVLKPAEFKGATMITVSIKPKQ